MQLIDRLNKAFLELRAQVEVSSVAYRQHMSVAYLLHAGLSRRPEQGESRTISGVRIKNLQKLPEVFRVEEFSQVVSASFKLYLSSLFDKTGWDMFVSSGWAITRDFADVSYMG